MGARNGFGSSNYEWGEQIILQKTLGKLARVVSKRMTRSHPAEKSCVGKERWSVRVMIVTYMLSKQQLGVIADNSEVTFESVVSLVKIEEVKIT